MRSILENVSAFFRGLIVKTCQALATRRTVTLLRGSEGVGTVSASDSRFSSSPSLPALDWQLPSHSGPYELRIEVQPKSHHRAHYETEGSRGAVKASAGGHPSVQVPAGSPGAS